MDCGVGSPAVSILLYRSLFDQPALFGSVRVFDAVGAEAGSFWQSVSLLNLLTLIWLAVAGVLLLYHLLDYILFRRHLLRWSHEPEQMAVLEMAELGAAILEIAAVIKDTDLSGTENTGCSWIPFPCDFASYRAF